MLNPSNKSLCKTIADYGYKLSDLELQLTNKRDELFEEMVIYETEKLFYQKAAYDWKKIWIRYFKCLKDPTLDNCPVSYSEISYQFSQLNDTYISYRKATKAYKTTSEEIIPEVNDIYNELKNQTGHNFDLLLDTIDDYPTIPYEVKNVIVSLGIEIKALKDSISINNTSIAELTAFIEINNPNIQERISYFDSLDININKVHSDSVNCMANCFFKRQVNCSSKCTK
jgi:hypothetical protein